MSLSLNIRHYLWIVVVAVYGLIVLYKAIGEYDYIYDSNHYENVMNAMNPDIKGIYFKQKCTSLDPTPDEPDPVCYSLPTVDSGTMYFDETTSRSVASRIIEDYNKVSRKYVALAFFKFAAFFLLLWSIPSLILYPFWEWFLDGFISDSPKNFNMISRRNTELTAARRIESLIRRYLQFLDERGKFFNFGLGIGFSLLLGTLDIITPPQYSFILLYLFPVALTTWFANQSAGFIVTVICTSFWARANFHSDMVPYSLNVVSTLSIFFVVSMMINRLRQMWEKENILSRTDQLTGALNRRGFDEIVEYEVLSLNRQNQPFSLAYLDLDNFKDVNDRFGHKEGDELLKAVVNCLSENLRRTDVVARMGGDEFTVFFPATDQGAVRLVMQKVMEQLRLLSDKRNWPVTFSIGVITSNDSNCDVEHVITQADRLMYEVKGSGKNNVRYVST